MGEDEQIRFDGSGSATLDNDAVSIDFATLKDAIMAWHRGFGLSRLRKPP
jgi:hypothetical protein